MPADRTERTSAASFAEAQALGLPLSSHGAKHAPSIARGLVRTTLSPRPKLLPHRWLGVSAPFRAR